MSVNPIENDASFDFAAMGHHHMAVLRRICSNIISLSCCVLLPIDMKKW